MSNYSYDIIIVFLLKTTVWMPSVIIMILSLNAHVCSKRISLSYQGFIQHAYFIIHLYCYFIIVYTWLQVLSLVQQLLLLFFFFTFVRKLTLSNSRYYVPFIQFNVKVMLGFWCLTPLSTTFQLYRGVSFIGAGNRSIQREPPTCRKSLINFITYCCIEYPSP